METVGAGAKKPGNRVDREPYRKIWNLWYQSCTTRAMATELLLVF